MSDISRGPRAGRILPPPGALATDVSDDAVRPPLGLLLAGFGSVGASALLLLGSGRVADLAGYVLATAVTVLLVSTYRTIDARRRSRPTYVTPPIAQRLRPTVLAWFLLLAGLAVGGIHVWRFAEAVART